MERFGLAFGAGDKVMQIVNDYDREVYNGDIGWIVSVDQDKEELVIRFDESGISYRFDEIDQVVLAYATTIHKSQGSEYPVVVIPVTLQHLAIPVGEKKACAVAVFGTMTKPGYTGLRECGEIYARPD